VIGQRRRKKEAYEWRVQGIISTTLTKSGMQQGKNVEGQKPPFFYQGEKKVTLDAFFQKKEDGSIRLPRETHKSCTWKTAISCPATKRREKNTLLGRQPATSKRKGPSPLFERGKLRHNSKGNRLYFR